MAEQPEIITHLKNVLVQQRLNFKNMLELLEQELDAVKSRQGDKLVEVSQKKESLLNEIAEIDQTCNQEQFLPFLKETPELVKLREEIKTSLTDCQQKNEVVYLTATQTQVAIEDVKRLLIGGTRNTTYDAYGQKQGGGSIGKGIKA